jgi:hypothetical protein
MSRPSHPPWVNHPNNIRWEYRLLSSSLCSFFQDPSSSLLGPNIFLNTLFSKNLSLCSSLKVRGQVSHPYSTSGKIRDLYILIFSFSYETGRQKILDWIIASISQFNLLLISSWMSFWFFSVVTNYLNFAKFSNDSLAIFIFWFCPALHSDGETSYNLPSLHLFLDQHPY